LADARPARRPPPDRVAAWTADYRPLPDVPDEFIAADGQRRPHWLRLLNALAALPADEFEQRFAAADRRIRDLGVSYRVHGEAAEGGFCHAGATAVLSNVAQESLAHLTTWQFPETRVKRMRSGRSTIIVPTN